MWQNIRSAYFIPWEIRPSALPTKPPSANTYDTTEGQDILFPGKCVHPRSQPNAYYHHRKNGQKPYFESN